MTMKYKDENGNWVTGQRALTTEILDIEGNFESNNVEGALRELANKTPTGIDTLKTQVTSNTSNIGSIKSTIKSMQEEIDYIKENGGGGGGSALPSIKSDFTDCAIEKGTDVIIPIFFSSPNMGNGTAYILVNNIEVDTSGVNQGNNNIKVKAQYLTNTENKIGIYVKDRAGIVSNQLSWTVIAGGIELTSSFDYEVDYGITDPIKLTYNIDTGITGSDITMYLTIDGNTTEYPSVNGYNAIDIDPTTLGLGTHSVSMYATVDKYTSRTLTFNLVIVSTDTLYLSSTFISGGTYKYGVPISINYRLSKVTTEEYKVFIKVDGSTVKTQTVPVGSYYWTATNLAVGPHTITIQVVSLDYSEDVSIDLTLTIEQGEYTPLEDYSLGLLLDLNAVGKSNTDDTVMGQNLWNDDSGNGHHGKLMNFNYGTNGFINDTLVCDNDAYVEIEWSPWALNATSGSTIDIIYQPINSGIEECRVIDYTEIMDDLSPDEIKPFKGLFADIRQAITSSASSGASAGKVNLEDEVDEIHLTWVLDRINKFMKVYIDGVLSRIMFLSDSGSGTSTKYEDFSLDSNIFLNSTKGENCGTYNIKRLRVYDHALTSDKVLQNHLANIKDLEKQQELYVFNYENNTLPKMFLTGDTTNMTPSQTVDMKIEYISPNEEKFGASFNTGIQNNPVKIQGTSSLQYVRHNYTIYLKDEYGSDMYYNPYGAGSVADYVFCLKADYVESSHANNTGMAKFINNCVYDTKIPAQLDNENCRTTINGFPIELYVNGEYLGVYNFNHDRYSYQSYGYDYKRYPNLLVYEINSNSNTSAGAFYRYGDNPESSANVTELEYYKRDFSLIYGNRTTGSDTYSEIKTLVEWVSVAEQDLFRETISEHFNTEYLFRYFLTVLMIGAVDSLGKNMKITTYDGKVWYPTFYDLDTILGIDNTGYLTIEPDVEIESGSYNTSNSNLWTKVWNFFRQELKEEWAKMRQGQFTLDNLMSYIYGEQISKIPAKLYNEDAEVKYLQFGSLYTYCCHGSKEHLIKRWLKERIAYVDSMLGYFTSQDDQITVRMNKTGYVSFEITPYIPLYFSVKWSNASGGTQTFKLKRGETKTFYYTSTTSTDQEVIIYHAQYVKRLDNLSNLNPSSCILANAKKLTNVEIHSPELYNINVTGNKFLRNVDLRDCTALGTVTATGSSLDVSNCKYLRYVDVYNTNLTEVQLNSSGGSLLEIYYPKSIQSVTLIKQSLLRIVGLPYKYGEEIPTSLYNIDIENCPVIERLNTSDDPNIYKSFASMVYCNNLTIRNSLDIKRLTFDGFYRLKNVVIENMYNLEEIGFNDLLPKGDASTLQYIGLSNCPLLEVLELNCSSDAYEITFANKAILNLGGLFGLKSIQSNCVLKGIETIVVPLNLESMFFTNEYGEGYSTIKNIWSSSVCTVNTAGATAKAQHVTSTYQGIDFAGMSLKNIDLGALVNIPKAINFTLYPTSVNPNFNLNRDGETYPYLQPVGTLDLSNYTESLAKFFDGVDLDKLKIVCTNKLPQTDLSYCFYNSIFSNDAAIDTILSNVSSITNLDYCFYKTTVSDTSILSKINMGESSTMNYTFAECPNITVLKNITIPSSVIEVEGMFYKCPLTSITNMTVNVQGSISGLFKGCSELTTITTLRIPNVTDVSSTFEGCTSLANLSGFELPASCTNVSNLFYGCYSLTAISMNFSSNITAGENWYPPNLETLNDTNIESGHVKMTNCSTLKNVNNLYINNGDYSDMFNGCSNLTTLTLTVGTNITGLARFIKGCSKITSKPFTEIPEACTTIEEMFNGTNITDITGMTFGSKITNATGWLPIGLITANNVTIKNNAVKFDGCSTLVNCNNLTITNDVNNLSNIFNNCTKLANFYLSDSCNLSRVTTTEKMFYQCNALTEIDFKNLNISSMSNMIDFFKGSSNVTIKNFRLTSNSCDYTRAFYYPYYFENIYIGNNDSVKAFGGGGNYASFVKTITGLSFGETVTNISEMFKSCPNLTHDFIMPSTINNCSNCFNGCTKMTHVHSNWKNTYDNEITPTDCYAGCTSITHIDDVNIVNYEGKEGLDEIPKAWGGYEFDRDTASIYRIDLTKEGSTTVTLTGNMGCSLPDEIISWGDGTVDTELSHTYSTLGEYIIKTKKIAYVPRSCITECIQIRANITTIYNYFTNCKYLEKIYTNSVKLKTADLNHFYGFATGCPNLKEIDFGAGFNCAHFNESSLSSNIEIIRNIQNIKIVKPNSYFKAFKGLNKLKLIEGIENFDLTNVSALSNLFKGCSSITSLDLSGWDVSNVTDMNNMFNGTKITDFSFINNWNPKSLTYVQGMFSENSSLESITLPNWFKNPTINNVGSLFYRCTKLKEIHNFDWKGHLNLSGSVGSYPRSVIGNCTALTTIEDINMGYTSILGTQHNGTGITNEYWSDFAWNIFKNLNNLQNINFTGTVTLYETQKNLRFFLNCNVSKFTLKTWQSFVDTLPVTTGSYTIPVNKGLTTIPSSIVSQITEKGYTLTT